MPNRGGATERFFMKDARDLPSTSESAKRVYYEEFPFLRWAAPIERVRFIGIELIDLDVLDLSARSCEYPRSCCSRVYLVSKNGERLSELCPGQWVRDIKFSLFRPSTWWKTWVPGATVKEVLTNNGDKINYLDLGYVVFVRSPELYPDIQVFKLPKKFDLATFIEGEREKLRQSLRTPGE